MRNLDVLGLREATIEALDSNGLIKTLAEPALVAISGETANFLAGGEFPIPIAATDERITVEFKKFGISLSFTPVVLSENQMSIRIQAEVSRTSRQEDIAIQGLSIPSLIVRRADTTVSVSSGGRLMIAGLLQNDEIDSIDGLPGLKDIPILGTLFRSSRFRSNQSELVVLLTAYLIRPITGNTHLAAPTDGFVPASDIDAYLMGRLYTRYAKDKRKGALPMLRGPLGYMME